MGQFGQALPMLYQSPRGWGPPPGAVSGRGGVYMGGQRLTPGPAPGQFFGPPLQGGANPKFGGGGMNSQGMPTQGGWGSLYGNAPRPPSPFGNNRGSAPTPYQAPKYPQPTLNTTAQVQTGGPPVLRKGFGF